MELFSYLQQLCLPIFDMFKTLNVITNEIWNKLITLRTKDKLYCWNQLYAKVYIQDIMNTTQLTELQ